MTTINQFVPFVSKHGNPIWVNVSQVRSVAPSEDGFTAIDLGGEYSEIVGGDVWTVMKVMGVDHG